MTFACCSGISAGAQRIATRLTVGTVCLSSSIPLATNPGEKMDDGPVTFPAGRPTLVTRPLASGSEKPTKTMGMA
jgi:hypothetical protein